MKEVLRMPSVVICFFLLVTGNLAAQDWPHFLGPDRNSTSMQKNLLRSWPETGPEILWEVGVGIGYGGPAIKDGKVYLLDRDDKIGDNLRCFDLGSGKELWNYMHHAPGSFPFPGSRSVPSADGNFVYACGALGDLLCIDINTHQPVWHKNIWTGFGGGEIPTWAITQCPLIHENLVIVASQTKSTGVVAFDKITGDLRWTTPSLGPVGYVSPVPVKIGDKIHIVMITAATGGRGVTPHGGKVAGIDPENGSILWEYDDFHCTIPSNPVLDAGDNKIMIAGGYRAGSVLIQILKTASGNYEVKELFKTEEFGAHTLPPVLIDGYFYVQYGTNERRDGLVCMNMEGEILWKTRQDPKFNKGSFILADGLLLATDGFNTLYLIQPNPTGFNPLSKAELLKEGGVDTTNGMTSFGGSTQNWAPMAMADGKLIIRDQSRMMCIKVAE